MEAFRARGKREVPPALTEKDVQVAKTMLADPDITVEEVAASTLYRHLPGGVGELIELGIEDTTVKTAPLMFLLA
ncbi:MAG: hypothetical protein IBX56_04990 [Methylomicrobium sp.]|nr:hypothetical protein [Methylomicrobium sp.]